MDSCTGIAVVSGTAVNLAFERSNGIFTGRVGVLTASSFRNAVFPERFNAGVLEVHFAAHVKAIRTSVT